MHCTHCRPDTSSNAPSSSVIEFHHTSRREEQRGKEKLTLTSNYRRPSAWG